MPKSKKKTPDRGKTALAQVFTQASCITETDQNFVINHTALFQNSNKTAKAANNSRKSRQESTEYSILQQELSSHYDSTAQITADATYIFIPKTPKIQDIQTLLKTLCQFYFADNEPSLSEGDYQNLAELVVVLTLQPSLYTISEAEKMVRVRWPISKPALENIPHALNDPLLRNALGYDYVAEDISTEQIILYFFSKPMKECNETIQILQGIEKIKHYIYDPYEFSAAVLTYILETYQLLEQQPTPNNISTLTYTSYTYPQITSEENKKNIDNFFNKPPLKLGLGYKATTLTPEGLTIHFEQRFTSYQEFAGKLHEICLQFHTNQPLPEVVLAPPAEENQVIEPAAIQSDDDNFEARPVESETLVIENTTPPHAPVAHQSSSNLPDTQALLAQIVELQQANAALAIRNAELEENQMTQASQNTELGLELVALQTFLGNKQQKFLDSSLQFGQAFRESQAKFAQLEHNANLEKSTLISQLAGLQKQLDLQAKTLQKKEAEIQKITDQNLKLQASAKKDSDRINDLNDEVYTLETDKDKLQKKLEQVQGEFKETTKQSKMDKKQIKTLESTNKKLNTEKQSTKKELKKLKNQLSDMQKTLKTTQQKLKAASTKNEKQAEQAMTDSRKIKDLTEKNTAASATLQTKQQTIENLKKIKKQLENDISVLNIDLEATTSAIEKLSQLLPLPKSEIPATSSETPENPPDIITLLETQIKAILQNLQIEVDSSSVAGAIFQAEKEALQSQIDTLKAQLEQPSKQLTNKQQQIDKNQKQIAFLQGKSDELDKSFGPSSNFFQP